MRASSCSWALARLALFAGGDHRAADDVRIRGHLAACPSCRLELGPFLRARRALVEAAGVPPVQPDLDEMHREIMAAVERLPAPVAAGPRRGLRAGLLAAGLFCVGLVAVQWASGRTGGLLEREPLAPAPAVGAPALPQDFGSRLQPLGHGSGFGQAVDSGTQGLMGRLRLRTLEFEAMLPVIPRESPLEGEEPEESGKRVPDSRK